MKKWLVIDTDAGTDDAVALCMAFKLASEYNYEIKMVTCVQGNCSLDKVVFNVAKCRAYSDCDHIPIYLGSPVALDGTQVDAGYFHGEDGLGDVADLEHPNKLHEENVCGIAQLVSVAQEAGADNDVHLTVLTLGPLTNIALALQRDDKTFMTGVDELVIMGGCGNARGNITRVAEFNVYNDVEAASRVFKSWQEQKQFKPSSLTVLSWDFCVNHPLPWVTYDKLLGLGNRNHSKVGVFLSKILHKIYGPHNTKERSLLGAVICDVNALVYCLNRDIFSKSLYVHIEVETASHLTKGMTVVDYGCCDEGVLRKRNIQWLTTMDVGQYAHMLHKICILDDADSAQIQ